MSISVQRCDSLYLSPHLDDVVLSCALRILKERREEKRVVVATIFSNALKLLPGQDLYKGRQKEDKHALDMLGVNNPLWLGFRDAPFRNWFYTSFQSIILGKHPQDSSYAEEISKCVVSIYRELAPQTIFIPLAVGTHIDHRLTHNIWPSLPIDANIIFYEDRPYSFLPYSLALRLKEIGADPFLSRSLSNDSQPLRSFAKGLKELTMYKNVLVWRRERFRYMLWAARKIKSPSQNQQLKLEAEIIATTDIEQVRQIGKAIAAYKSQLGMLYKDMGIFRQASAVYAHTFDATSLYAERYWKLVH